MLPATLVQQMHTAVTMLARLWGQNGVPSFCRGPSGGSGGLAASRGYSASMPIGWYVHSTAVTYSAVVTVVDLQNFFKSYCRAHINVLDCALRIISYKLQPC